jgi:hypothetical protein
LFLWNNTFQPYRHKIKTKLLKEWQKNDIENYCSDRPSNEELKDVQSKNVNTERCVKL